MEHTRAKLPLQPVLRFQVITDTHVRADRGHIHNIHFAQALRDIAATAPGSVGIMHIGDLTDSGADAEYAEVRRIWNENKAGLPPMLMTSGNHDVSSGDWRARIANFLGRTGMGGVYHDHWINGYHFIFLGSEDGSYGNDADLSEAQLHWLDAKLAEEAGSGKPKFVFLHQPLLNTVSGSSQAQGWHGVNQDQEVKAILARHPYAILFTGHTHWVFGSPNTMHGGGGKATMFNASSVAYLWTDEDEELAGSEGYYVEVHEDRVCVRGRDFTTGAWVEQAQFAVPIAESV